MEQEQGPRLNWRVRGWVMVGAGLFLVLLMAGVAWNLAPIALRPGVEVDGSTFTGTAAQGQAVLGLLALVGLFGVFCVVNGVWMIATGHRHPTLGRILLAVFLLLFAIGWAVRRGLV
jgi:hypothetical protein